MIRLKSAGKTDVGLKREENEDNFIMLPDHGLYVVADGMGGHASGRMASTLAVTLITEFIAVRAVKPDFQFEYPPDDSLSFEANVLANAIKYASERIFIESCKDRAMEGMGTTITAILATDNEFILAHVGDSRIYRQRDGKLKQMTSDHSLLNHMLEIGEVKPEDAHKFANKNVILRAVGLKDYVDVSVQVVPKRAGDTYLMCSDGLNDMVDDAVIAEVLRTSESLPVAVNQLIQLALRAGGKDNVTVVCISAEEVPPGEELGWGTGTFTRKQAEAAAAVAGAGAGGGAASRSVQRPSSPPAAAPPPARPATGAVRPATGAVRPATGAVRAARNNMMPTEPPAARGAAAQGSGEAPLNGQRMHAVRMPAPAHAHRSPPPGGWDSAPPQRQGQGGMPSPPRRQTGAAGMAEPPRGRAGTPPAPLEPVDAAFDASTHEPPHGPRQGPFGQEPASSPEPMRSGRRRSTPTDIPAYSPPSGAGGFGGGEFDAPAPPSRPPSGAYTAPPPARTPTPAGHEAPSPPPGGLQRQTSGIFQAPPPGVFPQQGPGSQAPHDPSYEDSGDMDSASPVPSRDTFEDVPVITRSTAPVARDTVREMPIIARAHAFDEDGEEEDPEEHRPTALVPRISRGQTASDGTAPNSHLSRPQSGEGAYTERTSYRDAGSIQVDSSLFTETQDDEESIVIDESLLMELDDDEREVTHKGPPPRPPGDEPRRGREVSERPTELLPITGTRRKS